MASVTVDGNEVVLQLSRMEALEAAHMHNTVSAPLSAVQSALGVNDPWPELRGVKGVGTEVPGVNMIGTRVGEGFKDFCVVHKHDPSIIITFDSQQSEFNRWVFTGSLSDLPPELAT